MFQFKTDLILKIPFFTTTSSIEECMVYLRKKSLTHIPICDSEKHFLGSLPTEDLLDQDKQKAVEEIIYDLEHFFLEQDNKLNIFEIYDIFTNHDTNVLPVINSKKQLIGVICKETLLDIWPSTLFLNQPSTSIIVSHLEQHYSLSVVSQIVESNNAKLFGVILLQSIQGQVHILIKKNNHNTKIILDDLRRHGYQILTHHQEDTYLNDLEQRSQYINKYLNI